MSLWTLTKRDTQPVTPIGMFDFQWTNQGNIQVTDIRKRKTDVYSSEALSRIANSTGMKANDRNMAIAALDWAAGHPQKGTGREYTTNPNL